MPKKTIQKKTDEFIDSYVKSSDLMRRQLGSVTIDKEDYTNLLKGMNENQKNEFYKNCFEVAVNPAFQKVIKYLINKQIIHTALATLNMDELMFGRGTCNGYSMVEELFNEQKVVYVDMVLPQQPIDQTKII